MRSTAWHDPDGPSGHIRCRGRYRREPRGPAAAAPAATAYSHGLSSARRRREGHRSFGLSVSRQRCGGVLGQFGPAAPLPAPAAALACSHLSRAGCGARSARHTSRHAARAAAAVAGPASDQTSGDQQGGGGEHPPRDILQRWIGPTRWSDHGETPLTQRLSWHGDWRCVPTLQRRVRTRIATETREERVTSTSEPKQTDTRITPG